MTICSVMESREGLVRVEVLDNGHLTWSHLLLSDRVIFMSPDVSSIAAEDILHVRVKYRSQEPKSEQQKGIANGAKRTHQLLVHHARAIGKHRLRMATSSFYGTEKECEKLAADIRRKREAIHGEMKDTRRMLVIINPISGRGKGHITYRSHVLPMFKACDITPDVIVTSRSGEIQQIMMTRPLNMYDGVVVLGGDGSFNEAISGLILRHMYEVRRDPENPASDVPNIPLPVAMLPSGTGCWLALHAYGTTDVLTAAIHVIKGQTVAVSVASTHEPDRLLCYSSVVHHVGFVGDLIRKCELNRWMGPARYSVTPHTTLLHRRLMRVRMTLYPALSPTLDEDPDQSGRGPQHPDQDPDYPNDDPDHPVHDPEHPEEENPDSSADEWLPVNSNTSNNTVHMSSSHSSSSSSSDEDNGLSKGGKLEDNEPSEGAGTSIDLGTPWYSTGSTAAESSVDSGERQGTDRFSWKDLRSTEIMNTEAYNMVLCLSRRLSKQGTMEPCLGADSMTLQVVKRCSLADFARHFTKFKNNTPGMCNYGFVETRQIRAMKVVFASSDAHQSQRDWYINSDGESVTIRAKTYYVRLHPRVLRVFGSSVMS